MKPSKWVSKENYSKFQVPKKIKRNKWCQKRNDPKNKVEDWNLFGIIKTNT